jgi:hypothetical protein
MSARPTKKQRDAERLEWMFEALEEVHYRHEILLKAKTLTDMGQAAIDLSNAMSDLASYHPGYDPETSTLPWQR